MSLTLYNKKRNFNKTPEPTGKEKSSKDRLRFVIQKHDASHLHYDFRLELDGVLKSWAVPKGPSLNPADKRLAMMVEDHPYDYRNFEGVIPEGNYGGGTVIVWDEGFYEPMDAEGKDKKEQEKELRKGLYSGNLKLVLHGKKVNGLFALFQLKKDEEGRSWLLVKKDDDHASEEDVTLEDKSVKTGKTIAQVAHENGTEPNHPEELPKTVKKALGKKAAAKKQAPRKATAAKKTAGKKKATDLQKIIGDNISKVRKSAMPGVFKPMLATLVDTPFDDEDWLFEIKWDGYRAVAYCNNGSVELISRNNKPFTGRYQPVTEALGALHLQAVFDGEVVAVNDKGLADFQMLQNWQNAPVTLQYFIFDIIWLDGMDLTALPLLDRKAILKQIIPAAHAVLKYSDHVQGKGTSFYDAALAQGLEGIMAKKANSPYEIGSRTESWLKVKVNKRQEVIIAGFTQPRNTRKFFGALLLGVYHNDELVYIGHTGSGFNKKSLEEIYSKLQPLVVGKCPFAQCPKGNMPVTWVKPKLVCEIKFTEWTKELIARHPIFMGLRTDKKPKDVTIEKSTAMASVVKKSAAKSSPAKKQKTAAKKTTAAKPAAKKAAAKTKATVNKTGQKKSPQEAGAPVLSRQNDQLVTMSGHELKLTNLNKLYWKKEGFTKGDMIRYYQQIAPFMLPYLMDRPQSLNRHPNGVDSPNFFQKDMEGKLPEWMPTHTDFSESTGKNVQYLVCRDAATLLYMANLGCIEINPWHARTVSPLQPDWCLIDLDPDKGNTYEEVVETAQVIRKILGEIGADSYPKTSGSTGLHIYIPLGARYSYEQSKQLAELVVTLAKQELPDLTSVERNPQKRKGKIYLDFLQNRETQTAAAPYSLRPKPGVPVSAPLHWDEVKKGLSARTYTAFNIFDRLKAEGDLFQPVLQKGIALENVLKKMQALLS